MPVIDDLNLSPKTRVVIWEINESIQDLKSKVILSEDSWLYADKNGWLVSKEPLEIN